MSELRTGQIPAHERFLWQSRRPWPATGPYMADFLAAWAGRGYLVLSVTPDTVLHGDPQFLMERPPFRPLLSAADYWQRQAVLHEQLRRDQLLHLPVAFGPAVGEPAALAWLVPAPAHGQLLAVAGYREVVPLSETQRLSWLLRLARKLLGGNTAAGQRAIVQPPADAGPARWHYGSYLGDLAVPGDTPADQLRQLLAGLPRYADDLTTPGLPATPDEAADWPLLLNQQAQGFNDGQVRVQGHYELLPGRPPGVQIGETSW